MVEFSINNISPIGHNIHGMLRERKITLIVLLAVSLTLVSVIWYAFVTGFSSGGGFIPPYQEVTAQELKDWVAAEGRTLLLPKWLPDGVMLTSANTLHIFTYSRWGDKNIRTCDIAIEFIVTDEPAKPSDTTGYDKVVSVGTKPIGIMEKTFFRPYYFSAFKYGGVSYMITGRNLITEEDLIHIIESMIL